MLGVCSPPSRAQPFLSLPTTPGSHLCLSSRILTRVKNLAQGSCPYLQEPEVDLIHDGQVAGQDALQQGGGPSLQGLREHGVVGVSAGIHGDVPCLKKHNTGTDIM